MDECCCNDIAWQTSDPPMLYAVLLLGDITATMSYQTVTLTNNLGSDWFATTFPILGASRSSTTALGGISYDLWNPYSGTYEKQQQNGGQWRQFAPSGLMAVRKVHLLVNTMFGTVGLDTVSIRVTSNSVSQTTTLVAGMWPVLVECNFISALLPFGVWDDCFSMCSIV